jgi:anti-anti-sigma regulatory factor
VILPARLDSAAAVQLAQTLADRQGADVVLDAVGVDMLGAKAMQTLLVAAAAWRAAGHAVSVINLPAGVRTQLADLGLSDTSLFEGAAQ